MQASGVLAGASVCFGFTPHLHCWRPCLDRWVNVDIDISLLFLRHGHSGGGAGVGQSSFSRPPMVHPSDPLLIFFFFVRPFSF
ncbi:hypothetical protein V6N11_022470 [Hibiscus sabdariffa]|uniref:Secreted protein n=1 Tax=Hibiscus sabdariffa TaxID=183260 RepID=A0ABR2TJW9_9ROSI